MRNVRIVYAKRGRMKYVSHLDMNRYMTRLIKISKIPAWHTEGFNKHLYLTFALPLSLGTTTDYDVVDIKITDDEFTDQMVVEALSKNAAEGIEVISAGEPKSKTAELTFAEYTLTYCDNDENKLLKLDAMLKGNVILAIKKGKKGKQSEINLAEKIKSIKTELKDNMLTVTVVLPAGNTENINPSLFLDAFVSAGNDRPDVIKINRNMLFDKDLKKFC